MTTTPMDVVNVPCRYSAVRIRSLDDSYACTCLGRAETRSSYVNQNGITMGRVIPNPRQHAVFTRQALRVFDIVTLADKRHAHIRDHTTSRVPTESWHDKLAAIDLKATRHNITHSTVAYVPGRLVPMSRCPRPFGLACNSRPTSVDRVVVRHVLYYTSIRHRFLMMMSLLPK